MRWFLTYIIAVIAIFGIVSAVCNFVWMTLYGVANTYNCGFTCGIISVFLSNLCFEKIKKE